MAERPLLTHVQADRFNAIGAALRVLICPRDGVFVAQGLEIDYCTSGTSVTEVQNRFVEGFVRTIESLLRRGRPLSALFKSKTPPEVWQAYLDGTEKHALECVAIFELPTDLPAQMPFDRVAFCNPSSKPATRAQL